MTLEFQPITDQIVKLTIRGDISDEDGKRFIKDIDGVRESLSPEEPLHYLVDAMDQGKLSAHTRQLFTEQNKNLRVGKVAVFGSNRFVRVMATFMLRASGRDNIRFFDTEADALAWLQAALEKEAAS